MLISVISAKGEEMFLGVPGIESQTGKDEVDSVSETFIEWDFIDKVEAFCCNMTASNTRKYNGVSRFITPFETFS